MNVLIGVMITGFGLGMSMGLNCYLAMFLEANGVLHICYSFGLGVSTLGIIIVFYSLTFVFTKTLNVIRTLKSDDAKNVGTIGTIIMVSSGVSTTVLILYFLFSNNLP